MGISLRCILGHKWQQHAYGDMVRRVDGKVVGNFVILRCSVCGDLKRKKFV